MRGQEPYKVGDILRYDRGVTALFQVTYISKNHGGYGDRYYGIHCMGGTHGSYHSSVMAASEEDLKKWEECRKWRPSDEVIEKMKSSSMVGRHEDS